MMFIIQPNPSDVWLLYHNDLMMMTMKAVTVMLLFLPFLLLAQETMHVVTTTQLVGLPTTMQLLLKDTTLVLVLFLLVKATMV